MAKEKLKYGVESIVNSYSQIFFSLNKLLGTIIILVTFIDPYLGICGITAVILINLFVHLFGFSPDQIRQGMYGFNALLLGLAMGYEYKFNVVFAIIFICAILLLLLITVWVSTLTAKHRLPHLTIPFILTYWLVYLSAGNFSFIQLQEQYIYVENYQANASQSPVYVFAHCLDDVQLPLLLKSYFKTLSATFFQNSVLAGIIIAAGLLYFSRIAFTLSVIGFSGAFFCFKILGLDTIILTDYLVGSNFVFMAIGLGCFFVVPNIWSYLSVIFLIPILAIFYISLDKLLLPFQLKSFTLSFSVLSILFLFFLRYRLVHNFIQLVNIQYYSAEKTIYKHLTTTKRFANAHLAKIQLPFWGEWKVSQGYNGKITHLGEWAQALDFVVTDEKESTFKIPGLKIEDFYCFNKPIIASLDGYVYEVINSVEENEIGGVNLKDNWGNTIILNHNNGLFSQISHIKKDSFKVKEGDFVTKGTLLATCGNSGRSPEPHIHFQMQLSPKKGSKTFSYPIAYFMEGRNGEKRLQTFEVPKENTIISNVDTVELLKQSYDFSPGKTLHLYSSEKETKIVEWKIFTDTFNRTYLHCAKSNSFLWFVNDGVIFYCYDFEGDKKSLLFNFYLANYKVLLAAYRNLEITDFFPLIHFNNRFVLTIQDFFAPFFLFSKANYSSICLECDNPISPKYINIQTKATAQLFGKIFLEKEFELKFQDGALKEFSINYQNNKLSYLCVLA